MCPHIYHVHTDVGVDRSHAYVSAFEIIDRTHMCPCRYRCWTLMCPYRCRCWYISHICVCLWDHRHICVHTDIGVGHLCVHTDIGVGHMCVHTDIHVDISHAYVSASEIIDRTHMCPYRYRCWYVSHMCAICVWHMCEIYDLRGRHMFIHVNLTHTCWYFSHICVHTDIGVDISHTYVSASEIIDTYASIQIYKYWIYVSTYISCPYRCRCW